jgi:hypothetical protein
VPAWVGAVQKVASKVSMSTKVSFAREITGRILGAAHPSRIPRCSAGAGRGEETLDGYFSNISMREDISGQYDTMLLSRQALADRLAGDMESLVVA